MQERESGDRFPTEKIVWRWTPHGEFTVSEDVAEEYAIESRPAACSGIVVWAKYHGQWKPNPFTSRPVIAELLRQLQGSKAIVDHQFTPAPHRPLRYPPQWDPIPFRTTVDDDPVFRKLDDLKHDPERLTDEFMFNLIHRSPRRKNDD